MRPATIREASPSPILHAIGALRRVEGLLQNLVSNRLDRAGEKQLYGEHQRHFRRRLRCLDVAFFPGGERSDDAMESLGNGAYASFKSEPFYRNEPAFFHVVSQELPAKSFLYYWRSSATIDWLRREAPASLKDRLRFLRNLRIHLREGFRVVGQRLGEDLWAGPGQELSSRKAMTDLDRLQVDVEGCRGKAAIQVVLEAAGHPLTRSEIARILQRAYGLEAPKAVAVEDHEPGTTDDVEVRILGDQVKRKTQAFFESLTEEERGLLVARGYADADLPRQSFRQVAETLGRLKEESYRLMERRILEELRERFDDAEELAAAVPILVQLLASHRGKAS